MALDGITIHSFVLECHDEILYGKIDKINQPEKDEIILHIRNKGKNTKLLLSTSASNSRAHFIDFNKQNPLQAPIFCMVLRKHLLNGKILNIVQPQFERIIEFHIESMNELGDFSIKKLIIEIMGKHSNLILVNENNKILDSIKHIGFHTSRVREVLPGKEYVLPPNQDKKNPLLLTENDFIKSISELPNGMKLGQGIVKKFTGISPIVSKEICLKAEVDAELYTGELQKNHYHQLYFHFNDLLNKTKIKEKNPVVIYEKEQIIDFSPFPLDIYKNNRVLNCVSLSEAIMTYFSKRDQIYRLNQKSSDTLKLIHTNLERCYKKRQLQTEQIHKVTERDIYRIYGDLITTNMYQLSTGDTKLTTHNFYSENNDLVEIPLDPTLTPSENAQKYFKKYTKAKNTFTMVTEQMKLNDEEIQYLESLLHSLENIDTESDIEQIRDELMESGYIRKRNIKKKQKLKEISKPLHFISKDNFHIFVGKNNKQNDELTLKFAKSNDLWLHTKNIPGSHVIIQCNNQKVPHSTIMEAALLAAYYSKAKLSSQVPVDYTEKRHVKKPNGSKPGMVIYETNSTVYVTPEKSLIDEIGIAE